MNNIVSLKSNENFFPSKLLVKILDFMNSFLNRVNIDIDWFIYRSLDLLISTISFSSILGISYD